MMFAVVLFAIDKMAPKLNIRGAHFSTSVAIFSELSRNFERNFPNLVLSKLSWNCIRNNTPFERLTLDTMLDFKRSPWVEKSLKNPEKNNEVHKSPGLRSAKDLWCRSHGHIDSRGNPRRHFCFGFVSCDLISNNDYSHYMSLWYSSLEILRVPFFIRDVQTSGVLSPTADWHGAQCTIRSAGQGSCMAQNHWAEFNWWFATKIHQSWTNNLMMDSNSDEIVSKFLCSMTDS